MTEITVLELHLHDASFTANAPNSGANPIEQGDSGGARRFLPGRSGDDESGAGTVDEDGGGSSMLPKLLAFVAIVALSVLARRVMGGEDEPVPL